MTFFLDVREDGGLAGVRDHLGNDVALAFCHPEDGGLVGVLAGATLRGSPTLAADVGFVHLDCPAKRFVAIVLKHRAYLVEHAPRGLVGNA